MFNRWFGGTRVMRRMMQRVVSRTGARKLQWLDVAGASGDIASNLTRGFAQKGVELRPVILDRALDHLPEGITTVQGDALALPFGDGSFDVVSTSLLLHDLEPPEIQKFMNEALRVARVAVVINELRRSWTHLALAYAGMPLYSRITRNDAIASVKKAYTVRELREIIGNDKQVEIENLYLCRVGIVVWK